MTTLQNTIERAENEFMSRVNTYRMPTPEVQKCIYFLRETIRTAIESAFEATAPVKYPENLIEGRSESKSGWAMRQANAVVDELRTKQAAFLSPDITG